MRRIPLTRPLPRKPREVKQVRGEREDTTPMPARRDRVATGTIRFDMAGYVPVGHVASIGAFDSAIVGKIVGGNTKWTLGLFSFEVP